MTGGDANASDPETSFFENIDSVLALKCCD